MRSTVLGWDAGSEHLVVGYDLFVKLREESAAQSEAERSNLRELAALALVSKGNSLGELGRTQDAIDVYDQVVDRFGGVGEVAIRRQVALALLATCQPAAVMVRLLFKRTTSLRQREQLSRWSSTSWRRRRGTKPSMRSTTKLSSRHFTRAPMIS